MLANANALLSFPLAGPRNTGKPGLSMEYVSVICRIPRKSEHGGASATMFH